MWKVLKSNCDSCATLCVAFWIALDWQRNIATSLVERNDIPVTKPGQIFQSICPIVGRASEVGLPGIQIWIILCSGSETQLLCCHHCLRSRLCHAPPQHQQTPVGVNVSQSPVPEGAPFVRNQPLNQPNDDGRRWGSWGPPTVVSPTLQRSEKSLQSAGNPETKKQKSQRGVSVTFTEPDRGGPS